MKVIHFFCNIYRNIWAILRSIKYIAFLSTLRLIVANTKRKMVYVSMTNDELLDHQNDNKGEKDASKSKPITSNGMRKLHSTNALSEKIKRKKVLKIIREDLQAHLYRYIQNHILIFFIILGNRNGLPRAYFRQLCSFYTGKTASGGHGYGVKRENTR